MPVADPYAIQPVVVGHERGLVDEAGLLDQRERRSTERPIRGPPAPRPRAGHPLDRRGAPLDHRPLLVPRERRGVLVEPAVTGDLVTARENRRRRLRERLERVARNEPARHHLTLGQQRQDPRRAHPYARARWSRSRSRGRSTTGRTSSRRRVAIATASRRRRMSSRSGPRSSAMRGPTRRAVC